MRQADARRIARRKDRTAFFVDETKPWLRVLIEATGRDHDGLWVQIRAEGVSERVHPSCLREYEDDK